MKESKDRTEQFMYSTASAANQAPSSQYNFYFSGAHIMTILPMLDSLLFNKQRQDPMGDGSPRLNSKGKGRAPQNGDILALNLDSAEEGTASENGGAFQQMQLVEQQVRHLMALSIRL
jgi:syntaxin 5